MLALLCGSDFWERWLAKLEIQTIKIENKAADILNFLRRHKIVEFDVNLWDSGVFRSPLHDLEALLRSLDKCVWRLMLADIDLGVERGDLLNVQQHLLLIPLQLLDIPLVLLPDFLLNLELTLLKLLFKVLVISFNAFLCALRVALEVDEHLGCLRPDESDLLLDSADQSPCLCHDLSFPVQCLSIIIP